MAAIGLNSSGVAVLDEHADCACGRLLSRMRMSRNRPFSLGSGDTKHVFSRKRRPPRPAPALRLALPLRPYSSRNSDVVWASCFIVPEEWLWNPISELLSSMIWLADVAREASASSHFLTRFNSPDDASRARYPAHTVQTAPYGQASR